MPLYPLPPLVFLVLMGWTLTYLLLQRPMEGLAGVVILVSGAAFYVVSRRLSVRSGRLEEAVDVGESQPAAKQP